MKVLVTGGLGYIGCHTIVELIGAGFTVISIDNLTNSKETVLDGIKAITGIKVKNYKIDLTDYNSTKEVFKKEKGVNGIVHFAALKLVNESTKEPLKYYKNNLLSLINILDLAKEYNASKFVFSSSCTVYGNPKKLPVTENTPYGVAMSPYAATKQMGERIIKDWVKNSNTACTILRYFNPVGAHPSSHIGELSFEHSQTLLPILTQVATKKRDKLTVFGNDYNTRDGTCIRDYIHVVDLARAHVKAFGYKTDSLYNVFNLGLGSGVTVLEIIKTFEQAAGKKVKWEFGARRVGDIEATYSNNKKALNKLNWNPKYTLKDMMLHAWNWQSRKRSSPIICRKTKGPDPHP